jgi:hypothetical protein
MGSGEEFEGYAYCADTVGSLLPLAEKFGIATAAEVNLATLSQRLRQETVSAKSSFLCGVHVGAWVRTTQIFVFHGLSRSSKHAQCSFFFLSAAGECGPMRSKISQ